MTDESSRPALNHFDAEGAARMVDVSAKAATLRRAVATCVVELGAEVIALLRAAALPKGDALATAKIAGIQAAKRTSELIPLCHGLSPEFVDVRFELLPPGRLIITSEARVSGKTGVEMEALVAASTAALTIYDMCKAASKDIVIGPLRLEEKTGGKSGVWRRQDKA